MTDPSNPRFEVPISVPNPTKKAENPAYIVELSKRPFGITVKRRSTGVLLWVGPGHPRIHELMLCCWSPFASRRESITWRKTMIPSVHIYRLKTLSCLNQPDESNCCHFSNFYFWNLSLNTTVAPLFYADQFLQFSTVLPTQFIYGLGEHRSTFLHDMNWNTLTMWARDVPPMVTSTDLFLIITFLFLLKVTACDIFNDIQC